LIQNTGFTLAEMAIVTLLIGILLTLGLGVLKAQMDSAASSATNKKEAAIKDALVAYLRTNWRLPCPDTNFVGGTAPTVPDGLENRVGDVTTACISNFGIVPYVTLGLPREMAMDGWGNYMSYHVSNAPAANDWTLTANFNPLATGTLTVNSAPATPITSNAVAVIVSHGKNGYGAYTIKGSRNVLPSTADPLAVDEQENTNAAPNLIYFKREYTDVQAAVGGAFDDVVMFLQADDLLTPLRSDGSLKSQSDVLAAIQNAVVAQSFATCTLPSSFTPVGQVYGSPVTYKQLFTSPISLASTPTNTLLFSLTVVNTQNIYNIFLSQVSSIYANFGKCP
jgi:type II secretory pathway pseudopilin PulG